jgi:predicted nucleic acid-binding Zn ribbon protein
MSDKPTPLSPQKKRRNLAVLIMLVAFAVIIFMVTIIRIKTGLAVHHG